MSKNAPKTAWHPVASAEYRRAAKVLTSTRKLLKSKEFWHFPRDES